MIINSTADKIMIMPNGSLIRKSDSAPKLTATLSKPKFDFTPSRIDGITHEMEADLRSFGGELIQIAGILLELPQVATAAAQFLFQKYFNSNSFVRHYIATTAMGCICLASAMEEAPKMVRQVMEVFDKIKEVKGRNSITPIVFDSQFSILKMQVIRQKELVRRFSINMKNPHKLVTMLLKHLRITNNNIIKLCLNNVNDVLRNGILEKFSPEAIACTCIELACKSVGFQNPPQWYRMFEVSECMVRNISERIMTIYSRPKPNLEKIEEAMTQLRMKHLGGTTIYLSEFNPDDISKSVHLPLDESELLTITSRKRPCSELDVSRNKKRTKRKRNNIQKK